MIHQGKRLYRSQTDARLAGVCGGLGSYFEIDPVLIRLVWVLVTCFTGFVPGTVGYLVAWLIIPVEPSTVKVAEPVVHPNEGPA